MDRGQLFFLVLIIGFCLLLGLMELAYYEHVAH